MGQVSHVVDHQMQCSDSLNGLPIFCHFYQNQLPWMSFPSLVTSIKISFHKPFPAVVKLVIVVVVTTTTTTTTFYPKFEPFESKCCFSMKINVPAKNTYATSKPWKMWKKNCWRGFSKSTSYVKREHPHWMNPIVLYSSSLLYSRIHFFFFIS